MKKVFLLLLIIPVIAMASSPTERLTSALSTLKELSSIPDSGAFTELLKQAQGIVIYPTLLKVGFLIGGQYGEGFVLRYDTVTQMWFGPSFVKLTGLSFGPQVGIQNTSLVLVLMNEEAIRGFTRDNFTLGGNVSVAAGPLGRRLSADTDYRLMASIYSYSITKGFFAGLSLEGAAVQVDHEANKIYYGAEVSASEILESYQPMTPEVVAIVDFLNSLMYGETSEE
ncbi:MAG: hypothetical protein DRP19_02220 [Thermotogae bacterium]|nr:MAG: hypothetical protein DRP19_02220 [Thermotogota bacterium]